jgi:pantoate kinase
MATVRVGGHITLLFSIHDDALLPRNQGSRGAGLCLEKGVQVSIQETGRTTAIEEGQEMAGWDQDILPVQVKGEIDLSIRGLASIEEASETMYVDLIDELRQARLLPFDTNYSIEVDIELPLSQGFGMSAAGLSALALACYEMTNQGSMPQYFRIAHHIERRYSGGLGDVLGLFVGGVELRTHPGSPPSPGVARSFSLESPVLLVWQSTEAKHTSEYIDHPEWKMDITRAGDAAVDRLSSMNWDLTVWNALLQESQIFGRMSKMLEEPSRQSMLASVQSVLNDLELQASVRARLCMLGTSCVLLPSKANKPLNEDDLKRISQRLKSINLDSLMTRVAPQRNV